MNQATSAAPGKATLSGVGVDWLTLTSSSGVNGDALWRVGEQLIAESEPKGESPTRWHGHGYEGWCVPHVALGARADGTYLRISGREARDQWQHALGAAERCTRADLAVDVQLNAPVALYARKLYVNASQVSPRGGRPPMRTLTVNSDGGQTFYLGSRSSEGMGRVYDKGRETETQPAGLWWRWELEAKQGLASWVVDRLRASERPERSMLGIVAGWFGERGARGLPGFSVASFYKAEREVSTAEKQLQWLAVGVRPTVAKLISRFGAERVATALGLPLKSAVDGPEQSTALEERSTCPQPDRSTKSPTS